MREARRARRRKGKSGQSRRNRRVRAVANFQSGGSMKAIVIAVVMAVGMVAGGAANAGEEELAKKSGCLNCHAVDTKKVGPAYKDVAAKFKGKSEADIFA